jgi:hypothetical protein
MGGRGGGALSVTEVVSELPTYLAVKVTVSVLGTGRKFNVKLAPEEPAGTLTVLSPILASFPFYDKAL